MLFLLPVPLCVMKVFMHVNGVQSQNPQAIASKTLTQKIPPQNVSLEIRYCPFDSSISFRVRHDVKPYPERNGPIRGAVTLSPC